MADTNILWATIPLVLLLIWSVFLYFRLKNRNSKLIIIEITKPTSLLDIREQRGTGPNGFDSNDWWFHKDFKHFAKEKIQGVFEVNLEQCKTLPNGWEYPHPTVLAAAYFKYLDKTGQRVLDSWRSRTSKYRVSLFSNSSGLHVGYSHWDDYNTSRSGIAPTRKS